jgi:hypothetical protein
MNTTKLPAFPNRHWRYMRWIVEKVLPRRDRAVHLSALDKKQELGPLIALESASTVASVFWTHAVGGFSPEAR